MDNIKTSKETMDLYSKLSHMFNLPRTVIKNICFMETYRTNPVGNSSYEERLVKLLTEFVRGKLYEKH